MAPRLFAKSGRYVPVPRVGVEPTKHDEAFERALNESARAEQKLMAASSDCLFHTCRMFLRAATQFDDHQGNLKVVVTKMKSAVEEGTVPPVAVAANMLLTNERGVDLTSGTPEANFLYAASCLEEAARDWGRGEYVASRANTVRCRSSLKTIVE